MKYLLEVSFLRPILALMVIIFHAFIIYGGGWTQPEGYIDIPIYGSLAGFIYNGMLETFVFISGYVYFYCVTTKKHQYTFCSLVKAKFKRLILPAWLWSIIYYLMIDNSVTGAQIFKMGGVIGHLWFLPMLFWCFLLVYLLEKYIKNYNTILVLCLVLSIISWLPLPFQISKSFYYLFYFYLGRLFITHRDSIAKYIRLRHVLSMWIFAVVIYFAVSELPFGYVEDNSLLHKTMKYTLQNLTMITTSIPVLVSLYFTALLVSCKKSLSAYYVSLGSFCMGAYIFQQFILKILYYQTSLPVMVGPYILPFVGIVFTICLSLGLTILFKRNSLLTWLL